MKLTFLCRGRDPTDVSQAYFKSYKDPVAQKKNCFITRYNSYFNFLQLKLYFESLFSIYFKFIDK